MFICLTKIKTKSLFKEIGTDNDKIGNWSSNWTDAILYMDMQDKEIYVREQTEFYKLFKLKS